MARVRVLTTDRSDKSVPVHRATYTAQVFEDFNESEPVWVCIHEHKTHMAAQMCGVQFLTDRLLGRRKREIS